MGVGDPLGMSIAHIMASGMGGIRTAGDLVAWMQMTRRMKISEAKKYVAGKLGVEPFDLSNEQLIREKREKLDIGTLQPTGGAARGIAAKCRIAELLEIPINSVKHFKTKLRS